MTIMTIIRDGWQDADAALLQANCPHSIVWTAEKGELRIVCASNDTKAAIALKQDGWRVFVPRRDWL